MTRPLSHRSNTPTAPRPRWPRRDAHGLQSGERVRHALTRETGTLVRTYGIAPVTAVIRWDEREDRPPIVGHGWLRDLEPEDG